MIDGKANLGWLRNIVHSLTQQIIRGYIGYWLAYVALRPDTTPRLVSYPYYTKLAQAGDKTAFRYYYMNIERFLKDERGGNMISGSVSIDDKTIEGSCTEYIPGFHRTIAAWFDDAKARSMTRLKISGFVNNVSEIYTPADAEKFGAFKPAPCPRG